MTTLSGYAATTGQLQLHSQIPHPIHRLMVLVPSAELREAKFAQLIWSLASPDAAHILLMACIDDWANEPLVQLKLSMLTAMLHESGLTVEAQIEHDDDWSRIVRSHYRSGDLVVCHAEQLVSLAPGVLAADHALSSALVMLNMPVYEVSGYIIQDRSEHNVLHVVRVWVVPLAIIGITLWLQINLHMWTQGWAPWTQQALLASSVVAEIALISRLAT